MGHIWRTIRDHDFRETCALHALLLMLFAFAYAH
jgi:hypothetical protein